MKRWRYNWVTALKFRRMMQYGWCPKCNSSPPRGDCPVCWGYGGYGPGLDAAVAATWAKNWAYYRRTRR